MKTNVCSIEEIESGSVRRFVVGGHEIAIFRLKDRVYAIGDRCTHGDVSLSEGQFSPETLEVECSRHGSAFSIESGVPKTPPAVKPVPIYSVTVEGGNVVVEV